MCNHYKFCTSWHISPLVQHTRAYAYDPSVARPLVWGVCPPKKIFRYCEITSEAIQKQNLQYSGNSCRYKSSHQQNMTELRLCNFSQDHWPQPPQFTTIENYGTDIRLLEKFLWDLAESCTLSGSKTILACSSWHMVLDNVINLTMAARKGLQNWQQSL